MNSFYTHFIFIKICPQIKHKTNQTKTKNNLKFEMKIAHTDVNVKNNMAAPVTPAH